jgi:hypothetical protein
MHDISPDVNNSERSTQKETTNQHMISWEIFFHKKISNIAQPPYHDVEYRMILPKPIITTRYVESYALYINTLTLW